MLVRWKKAHDGVNTRGKTAFAGYFRRVDDEEAGSLLIQHRLYFLRQTRPDFVRAVRRVDQENTAGLKALGHLVFVDKLQLVTADKICL
jgi:hypothetical protein